MTDALEKARNAPVEGMEPFDDVEYRRWGALKPLFRNYDRLSSALAAERERAERLVGALQLIAERLPLMPDPDAVPEEECAEVPITWRDWNVIRAALSQEKQT